ncbi:MAG: LysR family transcriptional regulator [Hyphomonadaceae bacterium]|nr:LysR family transcriptional regulator [Hyphomonadaceae bacterium]
MEMQQVRYFLALAKHLNFTRAAEECHVGQPALTRAVQALEAELGGELIRRERRTSHLTDLGRRMLPFLQQCYDSAMSAKALARSVIEQDLAPLTIAVSHTVNLTLIMGPLGELFRSIPGLQLTLLHDTAAELLDMLRDGQAELAVAGPLNGAWERLDVWPLREEGFVMMALASHPLAQLAEVGPADLQQSRLFYQIGCETRDDIGAWLATQGVGSQRIHEVTTQAQLQALLAQGLGVAITAASLPAPEGVVARLVRGLEIRRQVCAYSVAGRARSPAANLFLNLLRAGAAPTPKPAS